MRGERTFPPCISSVQSKWNSRIKRRINPEKASPLMRSWIAFRNSNSTYCCTAFEAERSTSLCIACCFIDDFTKATESLGNNGQPFKYPRRISPPVASLIGAIDSVGNTPTPRPAPVTICWWTPPFFQSSLLKSFPAASALPKVFVIWREE